MHEYAMNQPITGYPLVDNLIDKDTREAINNDLYYNTIPKTLWSGFRNQNPVDRQVFGSVLRNGLKTGWNAMRGALPEAGTGLTGQQVATGVVGDTIRELTSPFREESVLDALRSLPGSIKQKEEDYRASQIGQGVRRAGSMMVPKDREEWSQLGQRSKESILAYMEQVRQRRSLEKALREAYRLQAEARLAPLDFTSRPTRSRVPVGSNSTY